MLCALLPNGLVPTHASRGAVTPQADSGLPVPQITQLWRRKARAAFSTCGAQNGGYFALSSVREPRHDLVSGELLGWQKEFNTAVNRIRYVVEQVIAHFKT
jgi:hypothetical protein